MSFTTSNKKIVKINPGDTGFTLTDGIIISGRASIEVLTDCPREYKIILNKCIANGWIKPVAHIYDYEQTFDYLMDTK